MPKKDLGMIAMSYGYVYVARVAMGANDQQTLKAFLEAEAFDGPSLIIAYSHCIAHGIRHGQGPRTAETGRPIRSLVALSLQPRPGPEGKNPLTIDSKEPTTRLEDYVYNETRYRMLLQSDEERAEKCCSSLAKQMSRPAGQLTSKWPPCITMATQRKSQKAKENGP
jgi:pyruvate-ferredoxin/flavodoxin oxidoreductase